MSPESREEAVGVHRRRAEAVGVHRRRHRAGAAGERRHRLAEVFGERRRHRHTEVFGERRHHLRQSEDMGERDAEIPAAWAALGGCSSCSW